MAHYKMIYVHAGVIKQLELCKKEFMRHHPDLIGIKISMNKIVSETARFYLESP